MAPPGSSRLKCLPVGFHFIVIMIMICFEILHFGIVDDSRLLLVAIGYCLGSGCSISCCYYFTKRCFAAAVVIVIVAIVVVFLALSHLDPCSLHSRGTYSTET